MSPLQPAKLRKMIYEAQGSIGEGARQFNLQCSGSTSETACCLGSLCWSWPSVGRGEQVPQLQGCPFGLKDGWDFSRPADRRRFLAKLKEEEPDDVMLSPMCKLWSPLQELTASRSLEARRFLVDARAHDHEIHLTSVAVVYMAQH